MKENETPMLVVPFSRAAKAAHTTAANIKDFAKSGLLDAVLLPGNKRPSGVTLASLERLIRDSIMEASK
jgi:hypothetical protein